MSSVGVHLFVRPPLPGSTKTRLQPALGAKGAAALYVRLLQATLAQVQLVPECSAQLWVAGDVDDPALLAVLDAGTVQLPRRQQVDGDLGARMAAAATFGAAAGSGVLLIGTDCPVLDAGYLRQAVLALDRHDVVLGPATDGGYVLLGLTRRAVPAATGSPGLFQGMPWSTSRVAEETRHRVAGCGLSLATLDTLWDVDEPADLARLADLGWPLPHHS